MNFFVEDQSTHQLFFATKDGHSDGHVISAPLGVVRACVCLGKFVELALVSKRTRVRSLKDFEY